MGGTVGALPLTSRKELTREGEEMGTGEVAMSW